MHIVAPTVTVDTAIFASGDSIGGKITLTDTMDVSGGSAILDSILIVDAGNQKPVGKFYFFNSDPSASTLTNNAAAVIHANDLAKLLGVVDFASGDWHTTDSKGFGQKTGLGLSIKASGSKNLYCAYITTGTPTFVATTDFRPKFFFRRGLISK